MTPEEIVNLNRDPAEMLLGLVARITKERDNAIAALHSSQAEVERLRGWTYLPMDCPCGRRRVSFDPDTGVLSCEKCTRSSEKQGWNFDSLQQAEGGSD